MIKYPHFTIGELCNIKKGITGIASAIPGEYPLVNTSAVRKSCNTYQFDTEAVCIPLVSSTGHGSKTLNYVHYQKGKFALGTILAAVIPKDPQKISAEFLHKYLQFYKDRKIVPLMKGAANVSLAIKDIAKIKIPVPPIEEQISFIELFNKLNDSSLKLQNEFSDQSSYLTLLRQSILQEAVEGKLTAEWRKKNPFTKGNTEYDAAALLEKIKAEKQKLIAEGKIKKEKPLAPIKPEEVPFELPEGWVWTNYLTITNITGGKRLPQGYTFSKKQTKYIYIRIVDMKNGSINDSDSELKYIDKEVFNKISKYIITESDIYITIAGTIGQAGLVPSKFNGMNLTENAARVTPFLINKKWLYYFTSAKSIQEQFSSYTKGMAQPKLALFRIQKTNIPLPPLKEQHNIVERIDSLFATVDELEKQVNERKGQTEELMQTVLREAFEGDR